MKMVRQIYDETKEQKVMKTQTGKSRLRERKTGNGKQKYTLTNRLKGNWRASK